MGYFPNGSSGEGFQEQFCDKCQHGIDGNCAVWRAHLVHNYNECNNPPSILHMLIPRGEDTCNMFIPVQI